MAFVRRVLISSRNSIIYFDSNFSRVLGSYYALIGYAMDAGASIIVPQVETVEQARQIIAAAKFGRKPTAAAPRHLNASYLVLLTEHLTHHYLSTKISIGRRPLSSRLKVWKLFTTSMSSSQRWATKLTVFGWVLSMPESVWILSLGVEGDDAEWLKAKALYESTLRKHNKPASGLAFGSYEINIAMARGRSFVVAAGDMFGLMETGLRGLA